ncbi:hypothetical protein C7S14_1059 [Burkholderia cepacia]|nr:hypothetical protein C7S14_1059 [Burkholderia cepacia]
MSDAGAYRVGANAEYLVNGGAERWPLLLPMKNMQSLLATKKF